MVAIAIYSNHQSRINHPRSSWNISYHRPDFGPHVSLAWNCPMYLRPSDHWNTPYLGSLSSYLLHCTTSKCRQCLGDRLVDAVVQQSASPQHHVRQHGQKFARSFWQTFKKSWQASKSSKSLQRACVHAAICPLLGALPNNGDRASMEASTFGKIASALKKA